MPFPTIEDLEQEELTDEHKKLLSHVRDLVDTSRRHMNTFYAKWDRYDEIYQAKRREDEDDKKAGERGEPRKSVVPVTYSQVDTFVTFCFSTFTQRENFFELITHNPQSYDSTGKAEALLQRDLNKSQFPVVLNQFLLDIGRFGLGVMKCYWKEDSKKVRSQQQGDVGLLGKAISYFGQMLNLGSQTGAEQTQVTYQGNCVTNVSPYRFFPDTRVPLYRFQEGEFCASEDEFSWQSLQKLQSEGVVAGIEFVSQASKQANPDRDEKRYPQTSFTDKSLMGSAQSKGGSVVVTEAQVKIIPSMFMVNEEPIGEEDYPVMFLVWIANDARIIRFERMEYDHGEFTYVLSQFAPDQNHFLSFGLAELIDEMQDTISFLINSHITSVRKVIQNRLVVDPEGINTDDLQNRRSVIRLKPGKSNQGVDRWIKQLDVSDVTGNHMDNAEQMHSMVQIATGINDNALGQYNKGRRSATESRNVNAGSASRLKKCGSIIWISSLERLGHQMLSNLQQGLSQTAFVKMFGQSADPNIYAQLVQVTPEDIQGEYQFQIFDGTLESEKSYVAQTLEEVLGQLFSNPVAIQITRLDPRAILMEILRLRGVRTPERFQIQLPPAAVLPPNVVGMDPTMQNEQQPTTQQPTGGLSGLIAPGAS